MVQKSLWFKNWTVTPSQADLLFRITISIQGNHARLCGFAAAFAAFGGQGGRPGNLASKFQLVQVTIGGTGTPEDSKSFVAASSSSSCMLQVATGTVTGSERARGTSSGDSESLSKFTWVRIGLGGHDLIYYGMIMSHSNYARAIVN
jgi:hypothetical protein